MGSMGHFKVDPWVFFAIPRFFILAAPGSKLANLDHQRLTDLGLGPTEIVPLDQQQLADLRLHSS